MYNHNNYTTITAECPECKNPLQIRDNIREETYCPHCGIITETNTIPSITTIIANSQRENNNKEEETEEFL